MGALNNRAVTVLFNSDEEIGSVSSRQYIEEEARRHDLALVFEGGKRFEDRTTFVIERQGVGKARFSITGVSSHAGMSHKEGVNALEEMSHKILELQRLTDYDRGTTVSVGGNMEVKEPRNNVLPGYVSFHADFRYRAFEEAERLRAEFSRIASTSYVVNRKTGGKSLTELDFHISRPPMIPTQECLDYARTLQQLSEEIDHPMVPRTRPGTSDGCFTSGMGVTTIDGLGPVGSEWHTVNEYVELPSLRKRMELFIKFWQTLA
jgi:glutamate carboxypeptidase